MHLLHTKAPENFEGEVCLLARWIRRLIHFPKKQNCWGFSFGSCCRRLSGVWRSCLAVLLLYMRKGEELVMQLVKDCNTNYCCLKLRCCPWSENLATLKMLHWSPSPWHKILFSMTGCSLHYISVLKKMKLCHPYLQMD